MLVCSKCNRDMKEYVLKSPHIKSCPGCGVQTSVEVFPALYRPLEKGSLGESLALDDEANCFYHAGKRAVIPCEECGRFLCALCDMDFNGRHLCPACLEIGKRKHKIKNLENHRTLYDSISLSLAVVPMIFIWITFLTAPAVIFTVFRYWRAPTSLLPRTKIRFVLAFIIAVIQITLWSFFIYQWVT